MSNIEEELKNIRLKKITSEERAYVWYGFHEQNQRVSRRPLLAFFRFTPMTTLFIILVLLFGGGGIVAASNDARPGDTLFSVDLAAERARLLLSDDSGKHDLAIKFAKERLREIEDLQKENTATTVASSGAELGGRAVTEIEADVFTNETIVKIEADDQKFGFITNADTRAEIVTAIAEHFDIPIATVETLLVLEIEDRASRPDDIDFSTTTSSSVIVDTDDLMSAEAGFLQTIAALEGNSSSDSVEFTDALKALLVSLQSGEKIKVEFADGEIEIENEDGVLKVEFESEDGSGDDSSTTSSSGDDNSGSSNSGSGSDDTTSNSDDDDNNNSDSSNSGGNDDDDNSGSGSSGSDGDDDHSTSSDDDDNNSGSSSSGSSDDDDNSGSGSSSGGGSDDNSGSSHSDDDDEDNSGSGGN